MLNFGELVRSGLIFFAISFGTAVVFVIYQNLGGRRQSPSIILDYLNINFVSALGTWVLNSQGLKVFIFVLLGLVINTIAHRSLRNFTFAGRLLLVNNVLFMLFGLLWGTWMISIIPVSTTTRTLMFIGYPLLIINAFAGLISTFEQWEVLCRKRWSRPRSPLPSGRLTSYPKVSLHVPAYSEPPDVVISTLNKLAELRYPNFEVLMIDNNTKDPNLWKPVAEHCRRLGERFRFFHVDPIAGAKAGALNFALKHTAPDAEIIGVIDSDYHTDPDFLDRLVGYFADSKIGFVQTPHDYRDWEDSTYQRMCYWEYKSFFETTMLSLNERDSALTVGTMCLIRRKVLEEAGGWAEWCATEDSELSIRIHALGYSSVYTNDTFGRGLIPETFEGYKKQRFRWTYGPVQELKMYCCLYLPQRLGKSSSLTTLQKIHHMNHGLGYLNIGLGFLLIPIGIMILMSMIIHQESVHIPKELYIASFITLTGWSALWWLIYRVFLKCSLRDTIGALLATRALNHTYITASLICLCTREIVWQRTNKFKTPPKGLGALSSAQTELLLGVAMLSFVAVALSLSPQGGITLFLIGAILIRCFDYLAAPCLVLLSEHDLRAQRRSVGDTLDTVTQREDHPLRFQPRPRGIAYKTQNRPS